MFDQTDDMQYRRYEGNREYLFIEAIEDASYDGTEIPEDVDAYAVFSGIIRLDDYSQEEIENILLTYYPSYADFLEYYRGCEKEEIDGLIAEMIFETEMMDNTFHGHFTEDAADTFMQHWMDEMEKPLAQKEWEEAER